ncbi:MAG: AAA family ATPase [Vicinamibacterales bacterium]
MQTLSLGTEVRRLRQGLGLRLRDLAQRIDVSPGFLSQLENGLVPPPSEAKLCLLADVLSVEHDALLGLAGKIPSDVVSLLRLNPVCGWSCASTPPTDSRSARAEIACARRICFVVNVSTQTGSVLSPEVLRSLGVLTPAMLATNLKADPPAYVLEGLIQERSVNLVVGDSGLGKTPWLVGLAVAVSAGVSYMGRAVTPGPVLYADAEMGQADFLKLLTTLSAHLGLASPPENLFTFSLNWSPNQSLDHKASLAKQIEELRPQLVIVDPVRAFYPGADAKPELAVAMVAFQRDLAKSCGSAFVNLHHRRKLSAQFEAPSLEDDPRNWFRESAGSFALVNHTDLRLGMEATTGEADITLGGFARGAGVIAPIQLKREYDEGGDPIGYRVLAGMSLLAPFDQQALCALPQEFTFTQAQSALKTMSGSKTTAFLNACRNANLIRKADKKKSYVKLM